MKIECVLECGNHLGEGPVWDVEDGCLYWLDGTGRRVGNPSIWRLDPRTGATRNWSLDHDVGALALRRGGGAVLALADGFYLFDFASGRLELISPVDGDQPRSRLNDGKCDRRGRFFAGGMDDKEELKICSLWRLDPDLSRDAGRRRHHLHERPVLESRRQDVLPGRHVPGRVLGATTTTSRRDRSRTNGCSLSFRDDAGVADGSTIDEEGCVWNAQLISGDLVRYAPDGTVERRIGMPVRNITSCMFGGDKLDELYVTSMARVKHPAVHDLFAKEAKPQFLAGSLFKVTGLGVRGLPEPRFAA